MGSSYPRKHHRLLLLLLVLLLGWALRTHDLDSRSLWADEGWTMLLSEGPGVDDVTLTMVEDQHPPLFFILFGGWRDLTGDSEFATRYFSVLISVIAVALIAQLGRELFNTTTGILAALLLALADNHIDLAQEVRHYSLLATFVILSSLFYVRWWRSPSRTNRIGYVFASLALLYTHYLGGYILIAHLIHMLITLNPARPRQRLFEALFLFGAICFGFLPWFPVVIAQNSVRWDNPLYYQNALPNSIETYRMVRDAVLGQRFSLLLVPALLGLVYVTYPRTNDTGNQKPNLTPQPPLHIWRGGVRLSQVPSPYMERGFRGEVNIRLRPIWPVLLLVIWIGFMVGLTVWLNARSEFLTVRNFILITPAIMVLAGHGLANVQRTARLFTVAVILLVSLTTIDARRDYPNWRAVIGTITDHTLGGEMVLMDVWVGDFPARYYIDQQMGEATPRVSLREWRDMYKGQFLPTLLGELQTLDSFWLVYWGDDPMDEYGALIDQAGFQRTATFVTDHHGTSIYTYRYDKVPDSTLAQFGDLFALRRVHAPDSAARGETITVSLWWTAAQTPPMDYSVSVFLLDESGAQVAQHDGPPPIPTSAWQPGDLYYDTHKITLPSALPPGEYRLGARVYWYGDQQPLPVTMDDQAVGDYAALVSIQLR